MLKYIYFANRRPDLSPAAFRARWRQHGALATMRPIWRTNMLTYVQADRLVPSPIPGMSEEYDGVGMSMPNLPEMMCAPVPEDDAITQQLPGDELQTFSSHIAPRLMHAEQEILRAGEVGVAAYLAFADIKAAELLASLHAAGTGPGRIILNRMHRNPSLEAPFDQFAAILELGAPDEAGLATAFASDARQVWREAALAMVARESMLWDTRASQALAAPS